MAENDNDGLNGFDKAGRLLAAAMIGYQSGTSPQTIYKKYTSPEAAPNFDKRWTIAAVWLLRWMTGNAQEPLSLSPKGNP